MGASSSETSMNLKKETFGMFSYRLENKLDFKLYNDNSKKDLKLSKGIIHEEKSVVIRLPKSRRNPIRPDQIKNDIDLLSSSASLSSSSSLSSPWPMKIKEEYQDNLVGAFAGNYDRPIGSWGVLGEMGYDGRDGVY